STLSEEGNEVLKRALNPAESFASAQGFFEALKELDVLGIRSTERKAPAGLPQHHATTAGTTHHTRASAPPAVTVAPKKHKVPVKFLSGLLTVAAIGSGVYFLAPHTGTQTENVPPQDSSSQFSDDPGVTPIKDDTPPLTVKPAPAEPKYETLAEMPAVDAREEKLRAAIDAAEAAEKRADPVEAVSGWLRVARDFPESDTPRKRLDFVIDPLRKRPEIMKPATFAALKPLLVEAAQLDSLSAVLLLAEAERPRNLKESFAWYSTAAAKGRPEASLQLGLILSNGVEAPPELEKAFYYFTVAAEANEVAAKTALAECYLFGKGTAQNYERGIKWLKEAADQGNLRAMNRLADGYDHGKFDLPVNYDEAFRIWSKVVETKNPSGDIRQPVGEAHGNLGVLYLNGHGTTSDETRAVKLFTDGVRLGDLNSMYFLGRCTQSGLGGLPKNANEGQRLIKVAAAGGSKPAIDWCRLNGIAVEPK
ncbi:MAG: tetratricopeptide repeat protein, partial [Chthoniobacteraceae bacterium]